MSQWAKVGVTIKDLECFKSACENQAIKYQQAPKGVSFHGMPIEAYLSDSQDTHRRTAGYLCGVDGSFRVVMDTDAGYSPLTRRLGANGGKLCRDYTQMMVSKAIRRQGGIIGVINEASDGSLLMRVSIA